MNIKGFVSAIIITTLLCACGQKMPKSEQRVMSVRTITIGDTQTATTHHYVGTVMERTATVLSFEIGGNVRTLNVKEGDRVVRGQLLATVIPTTLRDAHYAAEATLRQAQDAYKRMKPLHQSGVISDLKWVEVETKLSQAQAAERIAREELSHSKLIAPSDGVIAQRSVEKGTNVLPGQQIYKLVDVSTVDVKVAVPEKIVSSLRKGISARITVGALNGAIYTAGISEIGVEANPLSHTYDIKLSLPNPGRRLMPGMVCNVSLQPGLPIDKIVIPMRAVELDTDNARFVWVVVGGKAVKRPISLGDFAGDGVEVVSGLSAGDRLIIDGAQKVSQGMRVKETVK